MSIRDYSLRLFAIDPGSDTLGWSFITFDWNQETSECHPLNVLNTGTITASKIIRLSKYNETRQEYGDTFTRLLVLKDELIRLCNLLQPEVIICESPFVQGRNVNSGIVLSQVRFILTEVANATKLPINWIPPQKMKKLIGANVRNSSKDNVADSIKTLHLEGYIKLNNDINLDYCSEHSLDSIGVGYAYVEQLKTKIKDKKYDYRY